jgi:hypothetical protein
VRDGAADALMGLQVSEEVQDYGPEAARDVTPAQATPRRGGVVLAAPDPEIDDIIDARPPASITDAEAEAAAFAAFERERAEELAGMGGRE